MPATDWGEVPISLSASRFMASTIGRQRILSATSGLLALVLWLSHSVGQAAVLPRTALVIGNSKYESAIGTLRNTDNDAKAVAKTLRFLGFSVMERHNLTRDQLMRSMDEFRKTVPGSDIALFYYAGHGISIGGANYLIPLKSGFNPEGADGTTLRVLAETRLFNAEQAVADMSVAGAHCNLVILDACRNTPLTRTGRTRSLPESTGLSEMTPPAGSLIAFATEAGHTAFDGDGTNGLYTEELLKYMRAPGLSIEQVFKRTRAGVLARSEGGQVPAEYSRLVGDDIYLAGPATIAAAPPLSATPVPTPVETPVPDLAALPKLAAAGNTLECLKQLAVVVRERGPGDYTLTPLEAVLEKIKNDLKDAPSPSPKVLSAAEACLFLLKILPDCLPPNHPQLAPLAAKAHNRRGDALLLLGRADDALAEFNAALPLAPDDAYILYNRGQALLATGKKEEAKADFTAAASDHFKQPKAKKLALAALAAIP